MAVCGVLGEFCRGLSGGRGRAGRILSRLPARYYQRPWLGHRPRPRYPPRNSPWHDTTPAPPPTAGPAAILGGASAPTTSASVGVLQHEELAVGVSVACWGSHDVISPCGSSEVTVRGQSADPLGEDAENGVLWARWSVFWAQRHLVWSVARMWAPEYAGCPLDSHVNPLYRT